MFLKSVSVLANCSDPHSSVEPQINCWESQNIPSWKGPTRIPLVNVLCLDWTCDPGIMSILLQPAYCSFKGRRHQLFHRWGPEALTDCIKYLTQYQTANEWQSRKWNPDFPSPSPRFSSQVDPCFAKVGASDLFLVLSGSEETGNIPAKEGSGDKYEKWNKYTCNQTSLATLSLVWT